MQAKALAVEIYKWIRDIIKSQLQNIKPVQVSFSISLREQLKCYKAITESPNNDVWGTSAEIPLLFLPRSGKSFWLVEGNFPHRTTSQKHYPDLGCDMLWLLRTCSSDLILWETTGRVAKCWLFSKACF